MIELVHPRVFFVGQTISNMDEIIRYLKYSDNADFLGDISKARTDGLSDAEILCSMFAKMCYKSLTVKQNKNLTKTRSIEDNLINCHETGHGSIFEHVQFNFIITDCSRICTHELVRHRVGTAFSQTSGRYTRSDDNGFVFDPILYGAKDEISELLAHIEEKYQIISQKLGIDDLTKFSDKKKLTSALRRILPDGMSNEIAFSVNLRALRHIIMLRTNRAAEWEIRCVFGQIYSLLKNKYKTMFHGAKETMVDGLLEITGMKLQPYETNGE